MNQKEPMALHVKEGDNHKVIINSFRVLIFRDGDGWSAQGIDIDYSACGDTADDVMRRFQKGFIATIQLHLDQYGHLKNFLKPIAKEELSRLINDESEEVGYFSRECLGDDISGIPYEAIDYFSYQNNNQAA